MKWIKTALMHLFEGANVAVVLLLWLSVGVTYLSPAEFPKLSLLSLAFPVFLLTTVTFVIFWLIFKAKRVWIPLVGIAACFSFVRDYCPFNLPSDPTEPQLSVITFNTHGFGGKDAVDDDGNNMVVKYLAECDKDIICLQETYVMAQVNALTDSLEPRGYQQAKYKGLTLFSRLPIIESEELVYPTLNNSGFFAKLLWDKDTILLINNHFESNHFSPEVRQKYVDVLEQTANPNRSRTVADSMINDVKPLVRLMAEAAPMRAAQADIIDSIVAEWLPRPIILCGDFNDTPVSYTHRVLTRNLTSAFRESGNGLGLTFRERGFPVRIDHILFSNQHWRSHSTRVDGDMNLSDHRPISTILSSKGGR